MQGLGSLLKLVHGKVCWFRTQHHTSTPLPTSTASSRVKLRLRIQYTVPLRSSKHRDQQYRPLYHCSFTLLGDLCHCLGLTVAVLWSALTDSWFGLFITLLFFYMAAIVNPVDQVKKLKLHR